MRLVIDRGQFRDASLGHRHIILRGINLAADAKCPSGPAPYDSYTPTHFFEADHVDFHARPFSVHDAPLHFQRLRQYGFNSLRYLFTWEALEHEGPGRYDEAFIQHTANILRIAKSYGFYVFMDPHQDVWSRFSGGSGAPLWTLYACGLNPRTFHETDAALVQNTFPDPEAFPVMIWSTNYYRLAVGTLFALFFAGKHFAPKCLLDGVNIQDYLQSHFIRACAHFAQRLREAGGLLDHVVVGWESLNEPNKGFLGHPDLRIVPDSQILRKGTCPTAWQSFLTASGRACEVDTYEIGKLGPYRTGSRLVDPKGTSAWLPADYDDSRYGYRRAASWPLGQCVWALHEVWDPNTDTLLQPHYFARNPDTGNPITYEAFTNTYFMDFYCRYRDAIRAQHPNSILFLQHPTLQLPPILDPDDEAHANTAIVPHFYDGLTLMLKKWNTTWNLDVVGYLRGKYLHPAFAIKLGETAIRNCFRDQLAMLRQEGRDRMGERPCVLGEFGIPYDMNDKQAYVTGDYTSQVSALDANYFAVEGALYEGSFLWVYSVNNIHARGDLWNGEDLSIVSLDDRQLPFRQPDLRHIDSSLTALLRKTLDVKDDALTKWKKTAEATATATATTTTTNETSQATSDRSSDVDSWHESGSGTPTVVEPISPENVRGVITNDAISAEEPAPKSDIQTFGGGGFRAAESFVRPTPTAVHGTILAYGFDLKQGNFSMTLDGESNSDLAHPTVIFLPDFHFPADRTTVEVSSGRWEIVSLPTIMDSETDSDNDGGNEPESSTRPRVHEHYNLPLQHLLWWHDAGKQTLTARGITGKHGLPALLQAAAADASTGIDENGNPVRRGTASEKRGFCSSDNDKPDYGLLTKCSVM